MKNTFKSATNVITFSTKVVIAFIFLISVESTSAFSQPTVNLPTLQQIPRPKVPRLESCPFTFLEKSEQLHQVNIQILQTRYGLETVNNYKTQQPKQCKSLYSYRLRINNYLNSNIFLNNND